MFKEIDAATLKAWLERDEAILVDVREPEEHQEASIAGSQLIPLATLALSKIKIPAGKKLVVHCAGGVRSAKGCEKLLAERADLDVYNLQGGIKAWIQANYPTLRQSSD